MKKILFYSISVLLGLSFFACGNNTMSDESETDTRTNIEPENAPTEEIIEKKELTGKHCFELETEKLTSSIKITFLEDNKVEGVRDVYVHDEDYLTTSESKFTGIREEDSLKLDVIIEIELDLINEKQTWFFKDDIIKIEDDIHKKNICKEQTE